MWVIMVEKVVVVKILIDRENVADITGVHVCACLRECGCCFVLGVGDIVFVL